MNNAALFIIFGSLLISFLASVIYMAFIIAKKSSKEAKTLDTAEDLQRIDTADPSAPRFSDKFVISSAIP